MPASPSSPSPLWWDRNAVLAATDLARLADELLAPRRGSGRSSTWPCPNEQHAQTGRTPPVTVFRARTGEQRWYCHGCGTGGTAIDLLAQTHGADVKTAIRLLAERAGIAGHARTTRHRHGHAVVQADQAARPIAYDPRPVPELDEYVQQCADALWQPKGSPYRRWLTEVRRLPPEVVRAARVGVDLGHHRQDRPDGLPRVRRAIVLPVLVDGMACYVQLRVLGANRGFPKYLNPSHELAPNPRLALYEPARRVDFPFERRELIVTEGIVDALSATAGGYRAAAVLGAAYADAAAVEALVRRPEQLVVAFDPDPAGRAGSERLVSMLSARGHRPGVLVLARGDLNENLSRSQDWPVELAGRVQHATYRPGLMPLRSYIPQLGGMQ